MSLGQRSGGIVIGTCDTCGEMMGLQVHVCPGPAQAKEKAATPEKPKRMRVPNLRKLLESPDETVAKAAKELAVQARLIELLAPLSPENRRRVLRALAVLHGVQL